jgi:branched-chain amino acid transport system ATP-binding protein
MTGCDFILLDEPSMGLAPLLMYEMFRTLKKLNEQGMTISSSSRTPRWPWISPHRGYVLDTGEIVAQGTSDKLKRDPWSRKLTWAVRNRGCRPEPRPGK